MTRERFHLHQGERDGDTGTENDGRTKARHSWHGEDPISSEPPSSAHRRDRTEDKYQCGEESEDACRPPAVTAVLLRLGIHCWILPSSRTALHPHAHSPTLICSTASRFCSGHLCLGAQPRLQLPAGQGGCSQTHSPNLTLITGWMAQWRQLCWAALHCTSQQ